MKNSGQKEVDDKLPVHNVNSSKYKKFKWKKTNFKTCLPKHDPVVIYVTANTKNVHDYQCMMHAGTLIQEFARVYTKKGHGKQLRENNTKLIPEDEKADLELHERVLFCHILDLRKNWEKNQVDPHQENHKFEVSKHERAKNQR